MKREFWLKVGLVGVAGLVFAPVAMWAIGGLIGIMAAAFIAAVGVMFGPVVAMKLANLRVKAVQAEAATNPIETRLNIYAAKALALDDFAQRIERFSGKILTFEGKLREMRKLFPKEAEVFERQLIAMRTLKDQRSAEYLAAKGKLEQYKRETEKAEAIWQMALAAREVANSEGMKVDPMREIAERTALDAVESEMNASFAQLDRLMLERAPEPQIIDVTPTRIQAVR